jgi:hypothetical protein
VDPVQDGSNWYVYCGNNPLCFVDPTGLDDEFLTGVLNFIEPIIHLSIDIGEKFAEYAFKKKSKAAKILAPELYEKSYNEMKKSYRIAHQKTKETFDLGRFKLKYKNIEIPGGYNLTVNLVSADKLPSEIVGNGYLVGKNLTIDILKDQSFQEIAVTLWHEIVEIGATEGNESIIDF